MFSGPSDIICCSANGDLSGDNKVAYGFLWVCINSITMSFTNGFAVVCKSIIVRAECVLDGGNFASYGIVGVCVFALVGHFECEFGYVVCIV